ncbi:S8 family serine peptidase [Streptomyces pathocidini]|uniref:S8 family serine peptidase n=1 Tax=Streptomyces pathocidini TaxID=1650571 RepID=A0ABW7UQC6_9ACTN|nr:S8 family serine peptidase [Streptomyces pathocidini]
MGFSRTLRTAGLGVLAGALLVASAPLAAADEVRDKQWALQALKAEASWKVSQGSGVTVAVIDDGVNANHIDLQGNVLEGKDFVDGGSPTPAPGDNHGTAMAALIAAHGHGTDDGVKGLAPAAKILPIRDFDSEAGQLGTVIRYAADNGASVINVSQCFESSSPFEQAKVSDAVAYALKRDALVVASAGNQDEDTKCYPAAAPGALGVGAVKNDGTIWENSISAPYVSLTAPGTHIFSAAGVGNTYRAGSGNSDSSAYVAAAAALLRSKFTDLTAGQIANRLVKTAALPDVARGVSLPDERYGYGSIQPLAALTKDIPVGSKYGPLKIPESLDGKPSVDEPSLGMSDAEQEQADRKALIIWLVIGVVGLVAIGLLVLLIVKLSRRKKGNSGDSDGPSGSAGYSQHGQQPFPPQQNPYHQPTHTSGQWPPQQ